MGEYHMKEMLVESGFIEMVTQQDFIQRLKC